MKHFPNLTQAVSTDNLRPSMNYAIVQNGRIIATDVHVLVVIDLKVWIKDEEQLKNIEGKILNLKLLSKLAKDWSVLIFRKDSILFRDKTGFSEFSYYSGSINDKGKMFSFDIETEKYDEDDFGTYPNWKSVLPMTDKFKLKITDDPDLQESNFSVKKIDHGVKAFTTDSVRMIATGGKNRPMIITPAMLPQYEHEEFSEIALIMPLSVH